MKATQKSIRNQEAEILLTRLADTFISQSLRVNQYLEKLSVSSNREQLESSNNEVTGVSVLHKLSILLISIPQSEGLATLATEDTAQHTENARQYRNRIRDIYLLPNAELIYNYADALSSSLAMFLNTINLYKESLGEKEKEQLFIIIEGTLNYESTYSNMHILHEANRTSASSGMLFPYSKKLSIAKKLMGELNEICRPKEMVNSDVSIPEPFAIQEWGKPRMKISEL